MAKNVSLAKRRIFNRYVREARNRATVDCVWEMRDSFQDWENVRRLNHYLARKRAVDTLPGVSPFDVARPPMPFLAPGATPAAVMRELIKLDHALRTGDFEEVEFRGNTTISLGKPAGDHSDTTVGPYDGPGAGTTVLAGCVDGSNVPSRGAAPLLNQMKKLRSGE